MMQGSELSPVNSNLVRPSGVINFKNPAEDLTNNFPSEIWQQIFGYLGCGKLRTFAEFARVQPETLKGLNAVRLVDGTKIIFEREDFLKIVKRVYDLAKCCQNFYTYTERERNLLLKAACLGRNNINYFKVAYPFNIPYNPYYEEEEEEEDGLGGTMDFGDVQIFYEVEEEQEMKELQRLWHDGTVKLQCIDSAKLSIDVLRQIALLCIKNTGK